MPTAYFSKKLKPAKIRYSNFDRKLLTVYLAIKHFCHLVEGHHLNILTDHKPLTHSLSSQSDQYTPRQVRHLDYIPNSPETFATLRAATIKLPMLSHAWRQYLYQSAHLRLLHVLVVMYIGLTVSLTNSLGGVV